jgi:hypothetical protein
VHGARHLEIRVREQLPDKGPCLTPRQLLTQRGRVPMLGLVLLSLARTRFMGKSPCEQSRKRLWRRCEAPSPSRLDTISDVQGRIEDRDVCESSIRSGDPAAEAVEKAEQATA